jgi:hypothetical protein
MPRLSDAAVYPLVDMIDTEIERFIERQMEQIEKSKKE